MDFIDPRIEEYATEHTQNESNFLSQLNRETHLKVLQPRMLSGHLQGRLLSLLSNLINPQYIVEIGTYTGYSALCLAEGLKPNGQLITIDCNDDLMPIIKKTIANSSYSNQIDFRLGEAMEILPTLNSGIDLVFIDADKSNYINYYQEILPKVKIGGLIIADNVLWSGKVLDPSENSDLDTQILHEFNNLVHQDNHVENLLLPIRDGLMILRKVAE